MSMNEYLFNNIDFSGPLTKIRDISGNKRANVWFYTTGEKDIWEQMIPTPYIKPINHEIDLSMGGWIETGDVILGQIPAKKYSESVLLNTTGSSRYYVIQDPTGAMETKAYVPDRIIRKDLFFFTMVIARFKSLNTGDLAQSFSERVV